MAVVGARVAAMPVARLAMISTCISTLLGRQEALERRYLVEELLDRVGVAISSLYAAFFVLLLLLLRMVLLARHLLQHGALQPARLHELVVHIYRLAYLLLQVDDLCFI